MYGRLLTSCECEARLDDWCRAVSGRTLVYSIDRMGGRTEYAVCVDTVGETIVQAVGDNKLKVWNKALEVVSEYEKARKL